uniref:Uncharacterized protein n=1 Tax=Setaria viridis TaxID=4556 RepID=A0A4U6TCM3_SETVI|nr:hypothetical protein SEVIR_9G564900v2 [Setaria viridis]
MGRRRFRGGQRLVDPDWGRPSRRPCPAKPASPRLASRSSSPAHPPVPAGLPLLPLSPTHASHLSLPLLHFSPFTAALLPSPPLSRTGGGATRRHSPWVRRDQRPVAAAGQGKAAPCSARISAKAGCGVGDGGRGSGGRQRPSLSLAALSLRFGSRGIRRRGRPPHAGSGRDGRRGQRARDPAVGTAGAGGRRGMRQRPAGRGASSTTPVLRLMCHLFVQEMQCPNGSLRLVVLILHRRHDPA